jgi:predicted metal-dependent enzyme (double-stranded beta helix superfamily)
VLATAEFRGLVEVLDTLAVPDAHQYDCLVQRAKPLLEQLLARMRRPEVAADALLREGQRRRLLYHHSTGAYTIWSMTFPPARTTPVHDHTTWGLIGVWQGEEHEDRFVRVDDHSAADYAALQLHSSTVNTPESVTALVPPDYDIHCISNPTAAPANSIHVYGRPAAGAQPRVYDIATGRIVTWDKDPLGTARAWSVGSAGPHLRALLGTAIQENRDLVEEFRRRLVGMSTVRDDDT